MAGIILIDWKSMNGEKDREVSDRLLMSCLLRWFSCVILVSEMGTYTSPQQYYYYHLKQYLLIIVLILR